MKLDLTDLDAIDANACDDHGAYDEQGELLCALTAELRRTRTSLAKIRQREEQGLISAVNYSHACRSLVSLHEVLGEALEGWEDQQAMPDPGSIAVVRAKGEQIMASVIPVEERHAYVKKQQAHSTLRSLLATAHLEPGRPPSQTVDPEALSTVWRALPDLLDELDQIANLDSEFHGGAKHHIEALHQWQRDALVREHELVNNLSEAQSRADTAEAALLGLKDALDTVATCDCEDDWRGQSRRTAAMRNQGRHLSDCACSIADAAFAALPKDLAEKVRIGILKELTEEWQDHAAVSSSEWVGLVTRWLQTLALPSSILLSSPPRSLAKTEVTS